MPNQFKTANKVSGSREMCLLRGKRINECVCLNVRKNHSIVLLFAWQIPIFFFFVIHFLCAQESSICCGCATQHNAWFHVLAMNTNIANGDRVSDYERMYSFIAIEFIRPMFVVRLGFNMRKMWHWFHGEFGTRFSYVMTNLSIIRKME